MGILNRSLILRTLDFLNMLGVKKPILSVAGMDLVSICKKPRDSKKTVFSSFRRTGVIFGCRNARISSL